MACPLGLFKKQGYTPQQRMQLFYAVCIFVRLAIAGIVYFLSDKMYLYYALIAVSCLAIYGNYMKIGTCVWWPSWFHLIIASLLFTVAVLTVSKVVKPSKYAAYLLYIDVLTGLAFSMYLHPWST